jgi:hypothetical protein
MEPIDFTSNLGTKLRGRFSEVKRLRVGMELRWLDDLRQYRGIYSPEIKLDPELSQTYYRMTRIKVRSITARLLDLLFPAGHEYPWSLDAGQTADMPVDPEAIMQAQMLLMRPLAPEEMEAMQLETANQRAKLMEKEIRDQLTNLEFRKLLRAVVHSGNLYGTGVLKGPLVQEQVVKHWAADGMGGWLPQEETHNAPYLEFVPVWDVYADPDAVDFKEATYVFQRHVMTKPELRKLAGRPDFERDAIFSHIQDNPDGDCRFELFETELRLMGYQSRSIHPRSRRYEVLEYWGVVDGRDLEDLGMTGEMEDVTGEYWVNAWLLGDKVIKLAINPIDGVTIPFMSYYFEKDETNIFGDGVAWILRDDQDALNASIRAMLDNAAVSAGSQFEVNIDLLDPSEDSQAIYPRRVWRRTGVGAEAQYPAIRAVDVPSHTNEFLVLAQKFETNIHESTVPSYMHGETDRGVGRTVGGLSMLMGTAQTSLKDQLVILDDDVIKPLLQALYHWNMQFNPREDIRGDFLVNIQGTSSMIAREVRSQSLEQFAAATANPLDAPYIDRKLLNQERAKALELPQNLVLDPPPAPPMQEQPAEEEEPAEEAPEQ